MHEIEEESAWKLRQGHLRILHTWGWIIGEEQIALCKYWNSYSRCSLSKHRDQNVPLFQFTDSNEMLPDNISNYCQSLTITYNDNETGDCYTYLIS